MLFNLRFLAAYIASLLRAIILQIGSHKVISIVTDHANNMRAAWAIIQAEFPWIICSGCKAHLLDLVCRDICKLPAVAVALDNCKSIVKFFRYLFGISLIFEDFFFSRMTPRTLLAESQQFHYHKKINLPMPSIIRWGTAYRMVANVNASLDAIVQVVRDRRVLRKGDGTRSVLATEAENLNTFLRVPLHIGMLKDIESILKPLCHAIKQVEGDLKNTSAAYGKVIEAIETAEVHAGWIISLGAGVKTEILRVIFLYPFLKYSL